MTSASEGIATCGETRLYTILERPDTGAGLPVMLVNGSGSTSVMWSRALIDPLLAAGHPVVRFDLRDVGRSTRFPPSQPYTVADLARDAVAVLDHWRVERAHLLGRSLGGVVALEVALDDPRRVATLALVYAPAVLAAPRANLPDPDPRVVESMEMAAFEPAPVGAQERIERRVADARLLAGTRYPFDESALRQEAQADAAHAPHAEPGHGEAMATAVSRLTELARVAVPTLVLHGTADSLVPLEHGRKLAAAIPGARLVEFAGLGHEMPPAWCAEAAPLVIEHFAAGETS